ITFDANADGLGVVCGPPYRRIRRLDVVDGSGTNVDGAVGSNLYSRHLGLIKDRPTNNLTAPQKDIAFLCVCDPWSEKNKKGGAPSPSLQILCAGSGWAACLCLVLPCNASVGI